MMIRVPNPTAESPADDPADDLANTLSGAFWQNLAAAGPDVEAALDDLATSGDEVVGRIALSRVGLPRVAGVTALRTVAVEDVPRWPAKI
jgi:hypothetical protein